MSDNLKRKSRLLNLSPQSGHETLAATPGGKKTLVQSFHFFPDTERSGQDDRSARDRTGLWGHIEGEQQLFGHSHAERAKCLPIGGQRKALSAISRAGAAHPVGSVAVPEKWFRNYILLIVCEREAGKEFPIFIGFWRGSETAQCRKDLFMNNQTGVAEHIFNRAAHERRSGRSIGV